MVILLRIHARARHPEIIPVKFGFGAYDRSNDDCFHEQSYPFEAEEKVACFYGY
jgi:hypothetical protein